MTDGDSRDVSDRSDSDADSSASSGVTPRIENTSGYGVVMTFVAGILLALA